MLKHPLLIAEDMGVLIVETIAKIRLRYKIKKQSIKQIARELGLSRNTVRKAIREDKTANEYQRKNQLSPKLDTYKAQLETWLSYDDKLEKKQRCSARKLYTRLKAVGYDGAYDSVQRFVKNWQLASGKVGDAYIPQCYGAGEAYQFDWSEETVELGGVIQKVKIAHFRLCYSRLLFIAAYPRETQEMLFDAHEKAFVFFGGIPLRGIYDNLKTAVDTIFIGKERKFNRRFMQMMSHYLVEPTACTPAAGWEKGQVENQVGNIREWVFTPRIKVIDMASLNIHLFETCLDIAKNRMHPEQKTLTITEVFEQQERASLQPSILAFDGYAERICNASSTCLVTYDRNRYSVDCCYANHTVSIRAYATRLVIISNGNIIAEHQRQFGRDKTVYNPWHYLPLLERKPGALRNGAPFKDWILPAPLQDVINHLMPKKGGDKQCVNILLSIAQHGLEEVSVACELALSDKVITADYILNILGRLYPTPLNSIIETPDNLKLTHEPDANCNRYNTLLSGGHHVIH